MAKKNEDKTFDVVKDIVDGVKAETKRAIIAIGLTVIALFISLAAFDKGGSAGDLIYSILGKLFGTTLGYWIIVLTLILIAASFLKNIDRKFDALKITSSVIFFISLLGLYELFFNGNGGIIGYYIWFPIYKAFSAYVSFIIFVALISISLMVIFDSHFTLDSLNLWKKFSAYRNSKKKLPNKNQKLKLPKDLEEDEEEADEETESEEELEPIKIAEKPDENKKGKLATKIASALSTFDSADEVPVLTKSEIISTREYTPPPVNLLEKDKGKPETGDIKSNANIIKRTLQNFGINVEMDEVSVGPTVTRYALKPAEGVKLAKIVALNSDLALALAAHPIRIEAPIPGKSLVGIEVPNSTKSTVGLATMLGSDEFAKSDKPLLVSLGKSITGKCHFANVAKAPHMLIAGTTGSGKSVSIHTIITSLLFRNSPEMMKFIFIDPKRVELTLYNKIPHLLTPVITDAKKAILALKWAGKEMARRYDVLEKHTVRDIDSYHKNVLMPAIEALKLKKAAGESTDNEVMPEKMPYIVIVIDELADIMQTYPRELESAVVKLAQMSRAVGIHLILSTQRPSVNVITGLIKANIPTRIALQVSSQVDSRTILDQVGAEKLLGAGDMLYLGSDMPNPVRLQSAYVSETEVKKVVKYLVDEYRDELMDQLNLNAKETEAGSQAVFSAQLDDMEADELGPDDDLYDEARRIILETGQASTSFIQRRLRVGYSRAGRLMDIMERKGVVGPANGSKPREILDAEYRGPNSGADNSPDTPEGIV